MDRFVDGALFTLFAAVSFYAGILTQRVTSLEQWRGEMTAHSDEIFKQLRKLETLIKNGND